MVRNGLVPQRLVNWPDLKKRLRAIGEPEVDEKARSGLNLGRIGPRQRCSLSEECRKMTGLFAGSTPLSVLTGPRLWPSSTSPSVVSANKAPERSLTWRSRWCVIVGAALENNVFAGNVHAGRSVA